MSFLARALYMTDERTGIRLGFGGEHAGRQEEGVRFSPSLMDADDV